MRPLRLRFEMPKQVLMVASAVFRDGHYDVELAAFRKDFNPGIITSNVVSEGDVVDLRVRMFHPENCFICIIKDEILSAEKGLENIVGKKASVFRPSRSDRQHSIVVVWGDAGDRTPLDEDFRYKVSQVFEGLTFAFIP